MKYFTTPPDGFFSRSAEILAHDLIGCLLRKKAGGGFISGVIVETEAYTEDDPASHSFKGRTDRNGPMFERGGLAYVYLIYGVHNCFNVTSGIPGRGEAVLIRAVNPFEGIELMVENRGTEEPENLCSGPGKLCQAFGIDRRHNGISLLDGEIQVLVPIADEKLKISVTKRIGITKATNLRRRFSLRGSRWVSNTSREK
ncbi:MAG: DNA-3-methyladenine glycosylase [Candidatus Aegiribacteria sp.]|nr:DNA-3-methyladenine glycosylase [Candidatus Aegiribacteria sp.]